MIKKARHPNTVTNCVKGNRIDITELPSDVNNNLGNVRRELIKTHNYVRDYEYKNELFIETLEVVLASAKANRVTKKKAK